MYGSYGSYSSMSSASSPMDIGTAYSPGRSQDASCAFPSWPQRQSLSYRDLYDDDDCGRATSYLSDEDLFLSDPLEDDARSISSASSAASPLSTSGSSPHMLTAADLAVMERERELQANHQREVVRLLMSEKERRRQQMRRQRQAAGGKKTSPKSAKLASMTPIAE